MLASEELQAQDLLFLEMKGKVRKYNLKITIYKNILIFIETKNNYSKLLFNLFQLII